MEISRTSLETDSGQERVVIKATNDQVNGILKCMKDSGAELFNSNKKQSLSYEFQDNGNKIVVRRDSAVEALKQNGITLKQRSLADTVKSLLKNKGGYSGFVERGEDLSVTGSYKPPQKDFRFKG